MVAERQRRGLGVLRRTKIPLVRLQRPSSHRNGPPSWSHAPAPGFRKPPLPAITGSAGRRFTTSTCDTPTWSEPLPFRRRRGAGRTRPSLTEGPLPAFNPRQREEDSRVSARIGRDGGVTEGQEPVLDFHECQPQLHVELDVAFEAVHGVLVEHLAVRVFEQVCWSSMPRQPSARSRSFRSWMLSTWSKRQWSGSSWVTHDGRVHLSITAPAVNAN